MTRDNGCACDHKGSPKMKGDCGCVATTLPPELPAFAATEGGEDRPSVSLKPSANGQKQARFHFRMDLCVGCHACEVACSEQNGLPVDTQWRRVGEVQAGTFPETKSFFISSGCNHCLEPACLQGCPVVAYKTSPNGIVLHDDQTCIGCGYCTWNCPYGVPKMQADRKIVTKCDLCVHRMEDDLAPACVQACPAGAILVEYADVEEIRANHMTDGVGPDMPSPDMTVSTTKITLPAGMKPEDFQKVDRDFVTPEEAHTPLILLTVFSQLGFGGFVMVFVFDIIRTFFMEAAAMGTALGWVAPALMVIVGLSLNVSVLHLGRPAFALRAVRNVRHSWLSREVVGLSLFAVAATLYSLFLFLTEGVSWIPLDRLGGSPVRVALGVATTLFGIAGIYSSSMLYRVPARPAWNSVKTTIDFFDVALLLGPAFYGVAASVALLVVMEGEDYLMLTARLCAGASLLAFAVKNMKNAYFLRQWQESDVFELSASAEMRIETFGRLRMIKNVLGVLASLCLLRLLVGLETSTGMLVTSTGALLLLLSVSLINRYIFFVTVVPKNIPGNFLMSAYEGQSS